MQDTTTFPPDFLIATQSLAETLLRAEPIAAYRRAQARFEADSAARSLLERLSTAQANIRAQQARNAVTQGDINTVRALQREVQSNRVIVDVFETQQAAVAYLREINLEISQLLGVDFGSLVGPASC